MSADSRRPGRAGDPVSPPWPTRIYTTPAQIRVGLRLGTKSVLCSQGYRNSTAPQVAGRPTVPTSTGRRRGGPMRPPYGPLGSRAAQRGRLTHRVDPQARRWAGPGWAGPGPVWPEIMPEPWPVPTVVGRGLWAGPGRAVRAFASSGRATAESVPTAAHASVAGAAGGGRTWVLVPERMGQLALLGHGGTCFYQYRQGHTAPNCPYLAHDGHM